MKLFEPLYNITMRWAAHRFAPYYLAFISTIESIFFPIPTDVMLAPMALANRDKAWTYAFIASVSSAFGGFIGYLLGYFAFETLVYPLLEQFNYLARFETAKVWFDEWGFWVVFIAGFSPIPYKVFTLTAGALSMPLLPFVVASVISRAMRFYLVAGLIKAGGETMEQKIKQHVEIIGWAVVALVVVAYFLLRH